MYDDYDLDYTYEINHDAQDLDEIYEHFMQSYQQDDVLDSDDEYERDTQDYDTLAYRHYAWYTKHTQHSRAPAMSAHTITQKRLVTVTLDIMCYNDLAVEDLDWRDLLDLQGDESVEVNVKDLNDDVTLW